MEFLRFLYTEDSVKLFAEKSGGIYAAEGRDRMGKEYLTSGVYNMNAVYEHGKSMVFGFAALPEGTKVSVSDMVFNPLSDVMNGTMTPEQWPPVWKKLSPRSTQPDKRRSSVITGPG